MDIDNWRGVSIKVVGIGGAGSNAVDRMIQIGIPGVDFIAVNSDAQALARAEAPCKIQLGTNLTRSLGAGGNPAVGARAAYDHRKQLGQALQGADMVFIAAGMGGGTGTGAAPVIAQIARAQDALTIAVVTMPFAFEGTRRLGVAEEGIGRLKDSVDTLIVVPNDRLLQVVNRRVSLDIAFRIADEVLRQVVQGISELVTQPGLINLDFADVRSIMCGAGEALVSIGHGQGEGKAIQAARFALESPLLNAEFSNGTENVLVNITGGNDLTLAEVDQAMETISHTAMPQAAVHFGTAIDPKMEGRVQITLIATGMQVRRTISVPQQAESVSLEDIFGQDISVPAFMRARQQEAPVEETHALNREDLAVPAFMRSPYYDYETT